MSCVRIAYKSNVFLYNTTIIQKLEMWWAWQIAPYGSRIVSSTQREINFSQRTLYFPLLLIAYRGIETIS